MGANKEVRGLFICFGVRDTSGCKVSVAMSMGSFLRYLLWHVAKGLSCPTPQMVVTLRASMSLRPSATTWCMDWPAIPPPPARNLCVLEIRVCCHDSLIPSWLAGGYGVHRRSSHSVNKQYDYEAADKTVALQPSSPDLRPSKPQLMSPSHCRTFADSR